MKSILVIIILVIPIFMVSQTKGEYFKFKKRYSYNGVIWLDNEKAKVLIWFYGHWIEICDEYEVQYKNDTIVFIEANKKMAFDTLVRKQNRLISISSKAYCRSYHKASKHRAMGIIPEYIKYSGEICPFFNLLPPLPHELSHERRE
jgi:hypothetical protein